jgi:hypothetical protein
MKVSTPARNFDFNMIQRYVRVSGCINSKKLQFAYMNAERNERHSRGMKTIE